MQFLGKISHTTASRRVSFWQDARDTEYWLESLGKHVNERRLALVARSWGALRPWADWQRLPLRLEGWLDPMEIRLTSDYLSQFLTAEQPEMMMIPCGGDAWVQCSPHHISIRAPRNSWLWDAAKSAWDLSLAPTLDEVRWVSDGYPQQARRYSWGTAEYRQEGRGWREWRFTADADGWQELGHGWRSLARHLGSRPMRVTWRQEQYSGQDRLLGLPVRLIHLELGTPSLTAAQLHELANGPEPRGVRAELSWLLPVWNAHWSSRIKLRRWLQSSRVEAHFDPTSLDTQAALRQMRREIRQLPILDVNPLPLAHSGVDTWAGLLWTALQHQRLTRLTEHLATSRWADGSGLSRRIRPQVSGWYVNRVESGHGTWVYARGESLRLLLTFPHQHHPGNITLRLPGTAGVSLGDFDPGQGVNRYARDWHYWTALTVYGLVPRIETWFEQEAQTGDGTPA
ncbi:MAG: hypothetical protein M0Z53_04225 [Thermaerobacter sp.]|nr:hypothetical protein [Thermaerobacter sp.]